MEFVNANWESLLIQTKTAAYAHERKVSALTGIPRVRSLTKLALADSSNKTSPLKVITLALIASAVVITGSALKDAYFP